MTLSGSLINLLSEAHLKNAEIFLQPYYEEVVSSGVAAIWYLGRRGTVVFVSIAPPCYSPDSATLCDQLKDDEGPSDVFLGGQPNKKTKVRSQHHFEKILSFVSRLRSRRSRSRRRRSSCLDLPEPALPRLRCGGSRWWLSRIVAF